jgi:hypothetical protein
MENHRNIQIRNVPDEDHYHSIISPESGQTLKDLVETIPNVANTKYDSKRQRIDVSVSVDNYMVTIEHIDRDLRKAQFQFPVRV